MELEFIKMYKMYKLRLQNMGCIVHVLMPVSIDRN